MPYLGGLARSILHPRGRRRLFSLRESVRVNRRTLLSSIVTAFAVCMMAIQIASLPRESGPGATFAPSGSCGLTVVSTAFARSGMPLRRGDTLALDRMSADDRVLATQDASSVGDRINYVVTRGGISTTITEHVD